MLFGISMVIAPGLVQKAFSYMVYASSAHIAAFGGGAVAYITFVHAVLGAVMFGWGAMLLGAVLGPVKRGSREGWRTIILSLACWFCPDTLISIWSGFWQNAVLNLAIIALFAIPLASMYGGLCESRT
jgi:hypothetical protein